MADRQTLKTATRVAAGDTGTNYDNVAVRLHWLTAALVVIQFTLGQTWDWFSRSTHHLMVVMHMSFGIILTLVIIARLLWRFVFRHHVASLESGWVRIASTAVHYLLYSLLATEAVLGFLSRWGGERGDELFRVADPVTFHRYGAARGAPASRHSQLGWLGNHNCHCRARFSGALSPLLAQGPRARADVTSRSLNIMAKQRGGARRERARAAQVA